MSKRYIFPQQHGDRKKAKLDVTLSDHDFPLSQNFGSSKGNPWGDDGDDELLLLASQACEDVYNDHTISNLPNYSMCMNPSKTSTQNFEPVPSTSKAAFTFKKPVSSPINIVTTKLTDKCQRISSPLPGISKVCNTNRVNISDDVIIDDNKTIQDPDNIYRQLLKLQEENTKLKLENGKLLENCVTKEGEASILRTQLKTSQIAVDNARLEKVKTQERVEMQWSDKLTAAKCQMHDLRTQLDFKSLEILSIKEKCKMLESNKVKLTQVTVAGNDLSVTRRANGSRLAYRDTRVTSSAAQTDQNSHFVHLPVPTREQSTNLTKILPLILSLTEDQRSILDHSEKLRRYSEHNPCRIYSTFHRLPLTPGVCRAKRKKLNMNSIREGLSKMAACDQWALEDFLEIFKTARELLLEVQQELEAVGQRMTTAFKREMDEKYIETSSRLLLVDKEALLTGRALYKEEQAILARRVTAVVVYILEDSRSEDVLHNLLQDGVIKETDFLNVVTKICSLLDNTTCSLLYSGLLLSITFLLRRLFTHITQTHVTQTHVTQTHVTQAHVTPAHVSQAHVTQAHVPQTHVTQTHVTQTHVTQTHIIQLFRTIVLSRPMAFVTCEILHAFSRTLSAKSVKAVCSCNASGNLKMDHDHGVLLHRSDSCVLQVMLKQIEDVLKCAEREGGVEHAVCTTGNLILLYNSVNCVQSDGQPQKYRCDCQVVLIQTMVYGLYVSAQMLGTNKITDGSPHDRSTTNTLSVCRSGIQALYQRAMRDMEFTSQLGYYEGHLLEFCEILRGFTHPDIYKSMLSEIATMFHCLPEDQPASYHQQAWVNSFQNFTIAD